MKRILIIENQYTQFLVLQQQFINVGYEVYPIDKTTYIEFLNRVRVLLNSRYPNDMRNIAKEYIINFVCNHNVDIIVIDHILVGCHDGETGIELAIKLNKEGHIKKPILFLSRTNQSNPDVVAKKPDLDSKNNWLLKGYEGSGLLTQDYFSSVISPSVANLLFGEPDFDAFDSEDLYAKNKDRFDRIIYSKYKYLKGSIPADEKIIDVKKWFNNFDKNEYWLANSIFEKMTFYNEQRQNELLENVLAIMNKTVDLNSGNICFMAPGEDAAGSGSVFLYHLNKMISSSSIHFPKIISEIPPNTNTVIFIDDIIGSGHQACSFFEIHKDELKGKKIYFASLVGFTTGINAAKEKYSEVFVADVLDESQRAFSDSSKIFPNRHQRDQLKEFAQKHGNYLYQKGPLGYDDSQALIAFSISTPNNTLPIIWAGTGNESSPQNHPKQTWNPLFRRSKV